MYLSDKYNAHHSKTILCYAKKVQSTIANEAKYYLSTNTSNKFSVITTAILTITPIILINITFTFTVILLLLLYLNLIQLSFFHALFKLCVSFLSSLVKCTRGAIIASALTLLNLAWVNNTLCVLLKALIPSQRHTNSNFALKHLHDEKT